MLHIFWFNIPIPETASFLGEPIFSFLATALAWVILALLVNLIFGRFLKWVMHNMPGEVGDITISILRKPLVILVIVFGTIQSLNTLAIPEKVMDAIELVANTIMVLVLVYLSWRVIKDIVLYYGARWARRTESRVDDILLPVLNLVGPLAIAIVASLVILPMWGVDISSILVPAGVVGLVLGLALQDPLSNIFSGISLLIESPFKTGDLVVMDGKVCQVERLGLRSTQFYSIEEHSTLFVPNRSLSNATLVNMTQPTAEQRVTLDLSIAVHSDLNVVQTRLQEIAMGNPCVLVPELAAKLPLLKRRISELNHRAQGLNPAEPGWGYLDSLARRYQDAIPKLEIEDQLNRLMLAYQEALRHLIRGIKEREIRGLTNQEIRELVEEYIAPADERVREMSTCAERWSKIPDPWINPREFWNDREVWTHRNEQLLQRWEKLKKEIRRPSEDMEMRLDDATQEMLSWLERDYKVPPYPWKTPTVSFKSFEGSSSVNLQLAFHIDNIRLEHDDRARRVKTEVAQHIREYFTDAAIWA